MRTLKASLMAFALTCSFISLVRSGFSYRVRPAGRGGRVTGSSQQLSSDVVSRRQQLIEGLPTCSVLRADLEREISGDGDDLPYMEQMRERGVNRASFELHAVLHGKRIENVEIGKRLYFRQFDGPGTQISHAAELDRLTDLQNILDSIAINQAKNAPVVRRFGIPARKKKVFTVVEFFSSPLIRRQGVAWVPSGRDNPLLDSVLSGDASTTRKQLESRKYTKRELDLTLFGAATSRYDNGDVIKLLLDAGANANAQTKDRTTPLMNAVDHPCNIRPLLDGGANLDARDKWGNDAVAIAKQHGQAVAVHLLEEARAQSPSAGKITR